VQIFITGIAGVLGSSLAKLCVERGWKVRGNDIMRREEAWRLGEVIDEIEYIWKSSWDISSEDLRGAEVVIDCAIGFADRPMGIGSPQHVLIANLMPALRLLEIVSKLKEKPIVIYPSSFNALYGNLPGTTFTEDTAPRPSSLYGFTKASAELLYYTYYRCYNVPVIITRVGSAFGPKMRSDELVAKLIIHALKGRDFFLRSPNAKRIWCYSKDVMEFYLKLLEKPWEYVGLTLHCAGNRGDEIITNLELANRIKKITNSDFEIYEAEYEPGEIIDDRPIDFCIDSSRTRELLKWYPKYSIEEGLRETVDWFRENLWRYL